MPSHSGIQYSQQRREREVFRYLPKYNWEGLQRAAEDNHAAGGSPKPVSSVDKALNAFAQLGALRLRTKRAMISLIDRDTQYIIAESTQTLSSQSDNVHSTGDGLLMGVRVIKWDHGLCGHALASGFSRDCRSSETHEARRKENGEGATVLHDLTADEQFREVPFVKNGPKVRFYAGVPIRTKNGYVIGSYCVLDDNPRPEVSDDELDFLRDMASTVMEHLTALTTREDHERAERMVKALGLFVEGRSSINEWWFRTNSNGDASTDYNSASDSMDISEVEGASRREKEPIAKSSLGSPNDEPPSWLTGSSLNISNTKAVAGTGTALLNSLEKQSDSNLDDKLEKLSLNSEEKTAEIPEKKQDKGSSTPTPDGKSITPAVTMPKSNSPAEIQAVFSRASNLIRESTGVDGAMFFEAGPTGFGEMRENQHHRGRREFGANHRNAVERSGSEDDSTARYKSSDSTETSSSGTENSKSSRTTKPAKDSTPRYCDVLGFSTDTSSSLSGNGAAPHHLKVADAFVRRILRRYPHGKIFAFDEDGGISTSEEEALQVAEKGITLAPGASGRGKGRMSRQDEAAGMLQIFPGSRSIMVLPLWDSRRERWYASSMLWTSDPTRVLTAEDDMTYLASFSNNIMAEVTRLETVAADHAKSTFISSISHELRSPLHGVMGSLELLHDTRLTRFQHETMDAIRQCSTTLLDTLNHVLDYAKINNFIVGHRKEAKLLKHNKKSKTARPVEGVATYGAISLASDISLDMITEDVVQAISLGHHQAQNSVATNVADENPTSGDSTLSRHPVFIILDVDWTSKWRFHGQSGAWRRILMNIFGNALKYTKAGYVNVRLECKEAKKASGKWRAKHNNVILTITDSGKGVSTDFIQSRIFTPFAQEDSLSPGTGLGLSIVQQIVENLHGTIDFQSSLGKGTTVKVTLPLERVAHVESTLSGTAAINDEGVERVKQKMRNQKLGFIFKSQIGAESQHVEQNSRKEAAVLLQTAVSRIARDCFEIEIVSGPDSERVEADIYIATEASYENLHKDYADKPAPGSADGIPLIVITDSVLPRRQRQSNLKLSYLSHPISPRKFANAILSIFEEQHEPAEPSAADTSKKPLLRPESFPPIPLPKTPSQDTTRPHLLLVDDNIINMKLLSTYIRKLGYPFSTAADGKLALDHYKSAPHKPAAIFMDISMPVMDGFTSARLIRAYEVENKLGAATIIALTGLASAEAQKESFSSGINLFMSKPVPMRDVKRVLEELGL